MSVRLGVPGAQAFGSWLAFLRGCARDSRRKPSLSATLRGMSRFTTWGPPIDDLSSRQGGIAHRFEITFKSSQARSERVFGEGRVEQDQGVVRASFQAAELVVLAQALQVAKARFHGASQQG